MRRVISQGAEFVTALLRPLEARLLANAHQTFSLISADVSARLPPLTNWYSSSSNFQSGIGKPVPASWPVTIDRIDRSPEKSSGLSNFLCLLHTHRLVSTCAATGLVFRIPIDLIPSTTCHCAGFLQRSCSASCLPHCINRSGGL